MTKGHDVAEAVASARQSFPWWSDKCSVDDTADVDPGAVQYVVLLMLSEYLMMQFALVNQMMAQPRKVLTPDELAAMRGRPT